MLGFQGQRWPRWIVVFAVLTAVSCNEGESSPEERDHRLAIQLTSSERPLDTWQPTREEPPAPVVLYVDRSGSMRGFLDPAYPARVDYRSVIDWLIVSLQPAQAFGFGTSLEPIGTSLGTIGNRDFYSDNNTELEEALERIARDSAQTATHLIIGDGRRSAPDAANEQYVRMRRLARSWVEQGGSFLVAASRAPFEPVPGDPAGCRAEGESSSMSCPLYAFAYVAPGHETFIVSSFTAGNVFEHVFIWPLSAASPTRVVPEEQQQVIVVETGWATAENGAFIARARGEAFTNTPVRARLALAPSSEPPGQAARAALADHRLRTQVWVRPLREDAGGSSWSPTGGPGSLVRPVTEEPGAIELLSQGPGAERHLYRVEQVPTGRVTWLSDFDAESAADDVRTYGLGRLFELFEILANDENLQPVQRAYIVVN